MLACRSARSTREVDVGSEARIGVAQDALGDHERNAGAGEQSGGGGAQVVEAEAAGNALGERLHAAFRAPALRSVAGLLAVAAALTAADVAIAEHQACQGKGAAEHVLELGVRRPHLSLVGGEDEVASRGIHGLLEVGTELASDGKEIGVTALGGLVVIGVESGKRNCRTLEQLGARGTRVLLWRAP
jgi:hypothetical protein